MKMTKKKSPALFGDKAAAQSGFRFDDDDVFFLSEVAKTLTRLAAQPSLAPEGSKAVRRAVAALKRLPELTPEINVQLEVAHRVSREGFGESCTCTINLDVDLGRAYEKAGRNKDARECYRRAAEGPEHNPAAWLKLAVLYSREARTSAGTGVPLRVLWRPVHDFLSQSTGRRVI